MKTAMDELSHGGNQILGSLSSIIQITKDVDSSSSEMLLKINNIVQHSQQINTISTVVKQDMQSMKQTMITIRDTIESAAHARKVNEDSMVELENLINRFTNQNGESNEFEVITLARSVS